MKFLNLKFRRRSPCVLLALSMMLVIIAANFCLAQRGKPKPPKVSCDGDGICESGEYDYDIAHDSQPCSDCVLETYADLAINQDPASQIVGANYQIGKIFQFKAQGDSYEDTWASNEIQDTMFLSPEIGMIDGEKTIVAVATYMHKVGKGKKAENYYDQEVFLYRDGSGGEPFATSSRIGDSPHYLWQTVLDDIDGDGSDELILHKWWQTEIYKWEYEESVENGDFVPLWTEEHDTLSFAIAVGDADNSGDNELLIGSCDGGIDVYGQAGGSLSIVESLESFEDCCIDRIRVKDVDNDGKNEILAGGTNNRLMVWKYDDDGDGYEHAYLSEPLAGYTQEMDVGDLDNSSGNEVVVGTVLNYFIYVLKYNGNSGSFDVVDTLVLEESLKELSVGDVNGDGKAEVVFGGNEDGVNIYHFVGGQLTPAFQCVYGSRGGPRIR